MATASWLLETPVVSPATASTVPTTESAYYVIRGIVLPFIRDQKNDFANDTAPALIESNAKQILGTRCSDGRIPGEIPWMQSFGSLLYKLRHQNFKPILKYQARAYAVDALARWEPRIRVLDVEVSHTDRSILVHTSFIIVDGNGVGRTDEPTTVTTEILKAA